MDFSFGFDTLNLKPRGVAIKVDDPIPKPVTSGGGQIVNFSLQRVTSMEDFQSSLDIGVKVLGSYGLFSGSAKFNYSESQKTKSFSDYVIVKVSVENPLLMIHGIKPTQQAINLMQNGDTKGFHQQFGDTFVQGIKIGGVYYAVLEFISKDTTEHKEIGASLDFRYLTFNGSAELKSKLDEVTKNTKLQISSFQMGGSDAGAKVAVTIEDIITKATNFPHEVVNAGVNISAFLQDYMTLGIPTPPNSIDIYLPLVLR